MGKKCIIANCAKYEHNKYEHSNTSNLSFHKLPSNGEVCRKWRTAISAYSSKSTSKNIFICSEHFTEDSYQPEVFTSKRILKRTAVPTIFNNSSISNNTKDSEEYKDEILKDSICPTQERETEMIDIGVQTKLMVDTESVDAEIQVQTFPKHYKSENELKLKREIQLLKKRLYNRKKYITSMQHLMKYLKDNEYDSETIKEVRKNNCNDLSSEVIQNELKNKTISTHSRRNKNKMQYSEASLQEALKAIRSGTPICTASERFGIPKTTLLYKKQGKLAPSVLKRGPECILGNEDEVCLVQWIFCMSEKGFPVTKIQLIDSVQMLLNFMKKKTVFKDNRPGPRWYNAFCARHRELSERMSQNLTNSRAAVTEQKLRGWFDEVRSYLQSKDLLDIDASRIFNFDESAFVLSPKIDTVLVKRGEKTVYNFIHNDKKECLTTLIGGNAAGQMAPPMIMFSYKRIPHCVAKMMPKEWAIGRSDNGWMTGKSFYEYIANVFYPWLMQNNIQFPVVVYVDGHSSHMTYTLSNFCRDKHIEMIAFFPNATHILQPMDVAVFHPLKLAWIDTVRQWRIAHNGERLRREKFGSLLQNAFNSLNMANILQSGFRTTGLYPFSVDAINFKKYFKDTERVEAATSNEKTEVEKKINTHLDFIERKIDGDVLNMFKSMDKSNQWNGPMQHESLFYLWSEIRNMIKSKKPGENISSSEEADEMDFIGGDHEDPEVVFLSS